MRTRFFSVAVVMATVTAGCDRSPTGPYGACPTPNLSPSPAGTIGATVDGVVAAEMRQNSLPGLEIALAKQGKSSMRRVMVTRTWATAGRRKRRPRS